MRLAGPYARLALLLSWLELPGEGGQTDVELKGQALVQPAGLTVLHAACNEAAWIAATASEQHAKLTQCGWKHR